MTEGIEPPDWVRLKMQDPEWRAHVDALLREAEDEYGRGNYAVWRPGDTLRLWEEMKRQRRQSDQ